MTKSEIWELVIKIFGLYCLLALFMAIPMVGTALAMNKPDFFTNRTLYVLLWFLHPLILFILAYLFLKKTNFFVNLLVPHVVESSPRAEETFPLYARLSFWIIIIGIYYFVSSASRILSELVTLSITQRGSYWWSIILSQAFTLILSLLFIFRSNRIERLIRLKSKEST